MIKQRMQIHNSEFRSVFTCARTVFRTEGLAAFYVSYPTTLTMTVPFTAVQFSVYEYVKRVTNPRNDYSPVSHMVSGGAAGAVAAAVTTPLDVAKTLLQTRGTSRDSEIRNARGMMDALRIIYARDGLRGFARGLSPRVLTHVPSNALCWLSYEFFSKYFRLLMLVCWMFCADLLFLLFFQRLQFENDPRFKNVTFPLMHARHPHATIFCYQPHLLLP